MKFRKMTAALTAAAMLAVSAPLAIADPLSVTANAEADAPTYKEGDTFIAYVNSDYEVEEIVPDTGDYPSGVCYKCTVKSDGTISIVAPVTGVVDDHPLIHETVTIPKEIGGYEVSEIGFACHFHCKKVIIPDSVKRIEDCAFFQNFLIEEIEFAGDPQLEFIGHIAFADCRSLKSITIPASVTEICDSAFSNQISEGINLGGSFINDKGEIIEYNLRDTASLTDVKFEKGSKVKTISQGMFSEAEALTSITLPEGVETIEAYSFANCFSLKSITIPASVIKIDEKAFGNVYGSPEVPNSLENISGVAGSYAETFAKEHGYSFTAITPVDEFTDKDTNISASADDGVIPDGAEFTVSAVSGENTETRFVYDISFTKDGKTVQVNGEVTIKLPVPEALKGKTVNVFRAESDGKFTDMKAKLEEGFLTFTTDHFSKYIVTTENLAETGGTESDDSSNSSDNSASDNDNPGTGVSAVATAFAAVALAGAAVIAVKKRK